jgi:hypothetical protein
MHLRKEHLFCNVMSVDCSFDIHAEMELKIYEFNASQY